jgi:hypothetical protein
MLHCVAFVRTDVSQERIASVIRVRFGELATTLAVTSNLKCYISVHDVLTSLLWVLDSLII